MCFNEHLTASSPGERIRLPCCRGFVFVLLGFASCEQINHLTSRSRRTFFGSPLSFRYLLLLDHLLRIAATIFQLEHPPVHLNENATLHVIKPPPVN